MSSIQNARDKLMTCSLFLCNNPSRKKTKESCTPNTTLNLTTTCVLFFLELSHVNLGAPCKALATFSAQIRQLDGKKAVRDLERVNAHVERRIVRQAGERAVDRRRARQDRERLVDGGQRAQHDVQRRAAEPNGTVDAYLAAAAGGNRGDQGAARIKLQRPYGP